MPHDKKTGNKGKDASEKKGGAEATENKSVPAKTAATPDAASKDKATKGAGKNKNKPNKR